MTVCYAYVFQMTPWADRVDSCNECGLPYWEHSHEEYTRLSNSGGKLFHKAIEIEMAKHTWEQATGGDRTYASVDLRPRYQMMMDRQPGVCDWYKLQAAKAVEAQADVLIAYAETPRWADGGPQTEPIEVTTWQDMMNRQRRWILPDGTEHVEEHFGGIIQPFGNYQPRGGHTK